MYNAKLLTTISIICLATGFAISYGMNNKTIEKQIEERNTQVLQECLSKARAKEIPSEILESARNCNENILTTISAPRSVETITGTHSTGNTVQPLGFQLIPQASASEKEPLQNTVTVKSAEKNTRTLSEIYEQVKCNAECKIETLTKLGITSTLSNLIVSECKEGSIDPRHCIIVASSIVINESGGGKSNACKTRYNCFGFGGGKIIYTSYQESVANFVSTYSRKWHKAKDSSFFYPNKGEYSPSRYCVSESSSNSDIGCPFGQKHMQNTWNKLEKLF